MGQPECLPDLHAQSNRIGGKEAPGGRTRDASGREPGGAAIIRREVKYPDCNRQRELREIRIRLAGGNGRSVRRSGSRAEAGQREREAHREAQAAGPIARRLHDAVGKDQAQNALPGHSEHRQIDHGRGGEA